MRRLEKASKPRSGDLKIPFLKNINHSIITLLTILSYKLGFYKLIQEIMEIELMLNTDSTRVKKYRNVKKPLRIKLE
jgi:hypothetical protein